MKIVKALITAMVITGAALAAPVMAADISNPPTALVVVDGTAHFGATFASGNMGNTFSDQYTFSMTGENFVDTLVASIAHSALVGLTITGYDLYDSSNALVGTGTMSNTGLVDLWTINTAGLAAGDYYVQVSGGLISETGASYAGVLNITPVPEPGTYAMLLAGLGLVGVAARRSKRA